MRRQKNYTKHSKYRDALIQFTSVANEVFRQSEDSLILLLLEKNTTYTEIADALDVSRQAIEQRVKRIQLLRAKEEELSQ